MKYHIAASIRKQTLVIETARNIDYLGCEIYDYLGQRITTKVQLKRNRYHILALLKAQRPEVYGDLVYAIVE